MSSSHTIKADSFKVSTDGQTNDLEISKGSESILKGSWKVDGSLKVEQGSDPKSPVTVSYLAESLVQFQKDCSEFWVPREEWEETSNETVKENTERIEEIEKKLKDISAREEIEEALANFYNKGEIDLFLSQVVHKTGDEYVQGNKTFLNNVVVANTEGTASLTVLPLGSKTNLGADAYGLHVSATGGLQLFGTHFLNGDLWSDEKETGTGQSVKIVRDSVSLTSTNKAAIGFDYANEVIFRTMPNDGREAVFCFEAWQWTGDSHTRKEPSAGVRLVKLNQKSAISGYDILNVSEGDARWGGGCNSGGSSAFGDKVAIGTCAEVFGACSIAIGKSSQSWRESSVSIGDGAYTAVYDSIAIGRITRVFGGYGISIGTSSCTGGCSSISIGRSANAEDFSSIAIGTNSSSQYQYGVAIGDMAKIYGENGIAVGCSSSACTYSLSIGSSASTPSIGSVAIGDGASSSESNSVAIGRGATAKGPYSTSISACTMASGAASLSVGTYSLAEGTRSIAIGSSASAFSDNSVIISPTDGLGSIPASSTFESVCGTRGTSLRMMLVAGEHHPNCANWISEDDSYIVFQSEDRLSADSFGIKIGVGAFFNMLSQYGGKFYTISSQQEASGGLCGCSCSYI